MRGVVAIYRRELAGLFVGPLAWVLLFIALLVGGLFFVFYLRTSSGDVDLATRYALGESWLFWSFVVLFPPLLTMRMIAEEAKSGTLEFLLTAPVSDAAVVTGKFLAATTFMGLLWSSVFVYALALASVGPAPDPGVLVGSWLGATLLSGLFCAVGLFWSSVTQAPIVAAFAAIVFDLVLVTAPLLAGYSGLPWLEEAIARVDVIDHHKGAFLMGVVDSAYAVFFLAWTGFFLFLATRAVEARRWRS